ncbi:unnamed protein product [Acanthoscelides obtectus]|uniref:Uncharacterized protein n=1 Tax=Acanthoscelides obtectus TaxID=200917 RepID=A0A9P0LTB6_ACAOB|nr:unnamed protein product [Acanthoscelides obtectus]CAK1642278.1 hypothetical protein AOBTE_LOCUS12946 [Acanthoscelides obtectus]
MGLIMDAWEYAETATATVASVTLSADVILPRFLTPRRAITL